MPLPALLSLRPAWFQDVTLLVGLWLVASLLWVFGINFIPYDSTTAFYPQSHFITDSLRNGEWPWWNPYQYSGTPLFGDPQALIFSLHTPVGLLFGSWYTLQVFDLVTLSYPLIGGLALYGLGYYRNMPRVWLLAGVLVFMLGGVATGRLQHVPQIVSYGMLPLVLWSLLATGARPVVHRGLVLGVLVALWGANANQVVFLGGLFLGVVAVVVLYRSVQRLRVFGMFALALAVAALLLAPVYAAMFEFVALSSRAELPISASSHASFPGLVYFSLVLPALVGNLSGEPWAPTGLSQAYLYIGVVPVVLYGAALWSAGWVRSPWIWGWMIMLAFFVLYAMGLNAPLYPLLFNHIPGFDFFRRPADGAYLVNFLLALGLPLIGREAARSGALSSPPRRFNPGRQIVGGLLLLAVPFLLFALGASARALGGYDVLLQSYGGFVVRCLLLAGLLVVLRYGLAKSRRFVPTAIGAIGLFITIDMSTAGRYHGAFAPRYADEPKVQQYRSAGPPPQGSLNGWLRANTAPWARAEVIGGFEAEGLSSYGQWYHTQGYNPLRLDNYERTLGAVETFVRGRAFPSPTEGPLDWRYDVLGLRYVAFPVWMDNPRHPYYERSATRAARHYRDTLAREVDEPLLTIEGYDIWRRPGRQLWLSRTGEASPGGLVEADCQVGAYQNTYLELSCSLDNPGTLVVGEIYAPGWRACRNGQPVRIAPYSDVFRSVRLPAGESTVVMKYRPVPFWRPDAC